jgi:hypothetical protein
MREVLAVSAGVNLGIVVGAHCRDCGVGRERVGIALADGDNECGVER